MADHSDLVAELAVVEKMSTTDRLKHAKKRRNVQLKKYSQYDKNYNKEQSKRKKMQGNKGKDVTRSRTRRVQFINSIMLLESASRNDANEVEYLLNNGVDPDVTNDDGLTALHQCCIDNLEGLLIVLLKHGANPNSQDSELWTPLHAAATCGHVHLCRILIEHGAELLAVNSDGNMPYDICEDDVTLDFIESEMAKRGVTQELIDETRLSLEHNMLNDMIAIVEAGGDINTRGRVGETHLHIAAANGYIQVTEFLLDHNVCIDAQDDDSWQPIHAAACWGHVPILELLVKNGADLETKTKNGDMPIDICEDPEVRQRIIEMRDELQSHRARKSVDLHRNRSQNSRRSSAMFSSNSSLADKASASIRRTSLREKMPIALREAREEAQRLRESATSEEEDDEYAVAPASLKPADIFMQEKDDAQGVEPEMSKTNPVQEPVVNGHRILEGIPSIPKRLAETPPTEAPSSVKMPEKPVAPRSENSVAPSSVKMPEKPVVPRSEQSVAPSSVKMPEKPVVPRSEQSVAPSSSHKPEVTSGGKNMQHNAHKSDNLEKSEITKQNPSPNATTTQKQDSKSDKTQKPPPNGVTMVTGDASPLNNLGAESPKSHKANSGSANHNGEYSSPPSLSASMERLNHARSEESLAMPPSGTLADLKKQRRLHDNNRYKDNVSLSSQADELSPRSQSDAENNLVNGHKTGLNGTQRNNTYYIGEDPPKLVFTATKAEVIGGNDESKTNCCTIL